MNSNNNNNKLLLHSCCAPCCAGTFSFLINLKIEPALFWFNPNVHPFKEFQLRKQSLEIFAKIKKLKLFFGESYDIKQFLKNLNGNFEFKKRCELCYLIRLKTTAQFAKQKGFKGFSSTLLISPYQNHSLIKKIGEQVANLVGVEFYYFNFQPFFKQGQQQAKQLGLHLQNYCGCVFSEQERFCRKFKKELKKQIK